MRAVSVGLRVGHMWSSHARRKVPILGKHTKRITCGAWSRENLLALGSDDRTLTVSRDNGDTVHQVSVRLDASDIQFSEMKSDEQTTAGENTVRVGGEWRRWGGEGSGGGGEGKESEGGGGATPSTRCQCGWTPRTYSSLR